MYDAFILGFGFAFGVAAAAGCIVVVMALCVAINNALQRKAEREAVLTARKIKDNNEVH